MDVTRCSNGGFQISYSENSIQKTVSVDPDTRKLNISSLVPCTNHEFRIRLVNYDVEGGTSYSSPANVKILIGKLFKFSLKGLYGDISAFSKVKKVLEYTVIKPQKSNVGKKSFDGFEINNGQINRTQTNLCQFPEISR